MANLQDAEELVEGDDVGVGGRLVGGIRPCKKNPGGKGGPPIREGGMPPNGLESIGDDAIRIRSSSDSWSLFDLARRF